MCIPHNLFSEQKLLLFTVHVFEKETEKEYLFFSFTVIFGSHLKFFKYHVETVINITEHNFPISITSEKKKEMIQFEGRIYLRKIRDHFTI